MSQCGNYVAVALYSRSWTDIAEDLTVITKCVVSPFYFATNYCPGSFPAINWFTESVGSMDDIFHKVFKTEKYDYNSQGRSQTKISEEAKSTI